LFVSPYFAKDSSNQKCETQLADANIPFVAECFSSIGEVKIVGGREITPGVENEQKREKVQ